MAGAPASAFASGSGTASGSSPEFEVPDWTDDLCGGDEYDDEVQVIEGLQQALQEAYIKIAQLSNRMNAMVCVVVENAQMSKEVLNEKVEKILAAMPAPEEA